MNRLLYGLIIIGLFACDENRIFEDNYRLTEKYWHVDTVASFTFDINELLSDLENLILFDSKTGQPKGSGLGDVFDHQFELVEKFQFQKQGSYTMKYQQFMRIDSLPMIHFVGARIAKTID
jgi:hypothetical protein